MSLGSDTHNYYNLIARYYDQLYKGRMAQRENVEVKRLLPDLRGKRVLDIGCGTGFLLELAGDQIEPENYLGMDIAANMIEVAKRKNPNYSFIEADIMCDKFRFKSGIFDIAISLFSAFSYIPLPDTAMFNVFDLLKWGGEYFIQVYAGEKDEVITGHNTPGVQQLHGIEARTFTQEGLRDLHFQLAAGGEIYGINYNLKYLPSWLDRKIANKWPEKAYTMIIKGKRIKTANVAC